MKRPLPQEQSQGMSYQRLLPLGSGGMANVYLALALGQSGFKRLVVVKSVKEELLANPAMRQMFLTEARVSARLNHPNVVQVSDVVDSPEGVMIVMEYLDGLALSSAYSIVGKAFSLPMRLRVICEVLAGLHYAHELVDYSGVRLGIVHRDVSPQNVFLTYDGRVKVLDFGIAKVNASPDQTRFGIIKGRIAYMPPEQLMGQRVDHRADIYATGCLLWEAIVGRRLWEKLPEAEIARRVVSGQVRRLPPGTNPELERIVSRAMVYSPDQRYPTAEAMRVELEAFLNSVSPVMLREVGQLLTTVCKDRLDRRQKEIAEAIQRVESEFAALEIEPVEVEPDSRGAWSSGVRTAKPVSQTPSEAHSRPRHSNVDTDMLVASAPASVRRGLRPRRRGLWLALALGAAAVAGVVLWPTRDVAPEGPATGAPVPITTGTTRMLSIEAKPVGARVLIDGEPAAKNPAVLTVANGSRHAVRVELDGHEPAERTIVVEADTSLTIELTPLPSAAPEPSASASDTKAGKRRVRSVGPRPVAQPPGNSAAQTAEDPCKPPYYFLDGIKTYKPECI